MIASRDTWHMDALKELINIGVGRGASVLNTMLQSHIQLEVPSVEIISKEELKDYISNIDNDESISAVNMGFSGKFSGNTQLMFSTTSASHLVSTLSDEDVLNDSIDDIRAGTLTEIGNIVLNGVMGSISNILNLTFDYSVPTYFEGSTDDILGNVSDDSTPVILLARTQFNVRELNVSGTIILHFEIESMNALIEAIRQYGNGYNDH